MATTNHIFCPFPQSQSHYSSEEDGETISAAMAGAKAEDVVFCGRPFNKERLKEQIEAGGGVVYRYTRSYFHAPPIDGVVCTSDCGRESVRRSKDWPVGLIDDCCDTLAAARWLIVDSCDTISVSSPCRQ